MFSIIQAAGWPIWPLIFCSVAALTLIIERLSSLRTSKVAPPQLLDEVVSVTRARLPSADVVNKLADNSVLGSVLASGLRAVIAEPQISEAALRDVFESSGRAAVHRLERYLNALGTIASTAPLLGPTMRALAVQVNEVAGVSGLVFPGDRVDLFLIRQPDAAMPYADLLAQNIRVLAVGSDSESGPARCTTIFTSPSPWIGLRSGR